MIQILALRPYIASDGTEKISEKWFDKKIRSISVEQILLDPDEILKAIETTENWNVYYTCADCLEESGRKFYSQSVVPFDIDGLDLPHDTSIPRDKIKHVAIAACEALGVSFDEVGIVFSGNGLQILIPLMSAFADRSYFDDAREHYRACCDKIDAKLGTHNLKGKADPSVWSPGRLLRMPNTYNRKPNKPERKSFVMQPNMTAKDWSLENVSGIPTLKAGDHLNPKACFDNFSNDPTAIMGEKIGCDFMKFAFAHPEQMPEPWWFASLSITERMPNGPELSHKMSKGHPKYSYKETEAKRKHAASEKHGPRTCKSIEGLGFDCSKCPQYGKVASPIMIEGPDSIKTMNSGFYFSKISKEGIKVKGLPDHQGLWRFFKRTHDYVSVSDTPELYAYKDKYWEALSRDDVLAFAHKNFNPPPMIRDRNEFYSFAKISNLVRRNHFENPQEGLFNFQNGVFDLKTNEMTPHSKDYPFRHILPCDFDPAATSPLFDKFMLEITANRQSLINCLQEYMGYIIAGGECEHAVALVAIGSGANGKSTFTNVLRALTGTSCSSLSGADIQDPAKRLGMVGKILNIAEENNKESFRDTASLKNMISGGTVWAKQLYSQPFEFVNRAKFVFLCNELPRNYDNTDGFYRRLIIIPFDARFHADDVNTDIKMIKKLLPELAGIFNFALAGYKRLLLNGKFTKPEESMQIIEEYSSASDHIKSWLDERMQFVQSDQVRHSKDDLYELYKIYCGEIGVKHYEHKNRFFMDLKSKYQKIGIPWKDIRPGGDGSRPRFLYYLQPKGPNLSVVIDTDGVKFESKD